MTDCIVTAQLLQIHEQPKVKSPVHQTVHRGTHLTFVRIVQGDTVNLNGHNDANWGQSPDHFFFPLGGTNHPNK